MSSQYFPPDVVGRSNNVKVVLDFSAYLRKKTLVEKEDLDYFYGKSYFDGEDGVQNYLVFQVKKEYFKQQLFDSIAIVSIYNKIWRSKGASNETFIIPKSKTIKSMLIKPSHVVLEKENDIIVQRTSNAVTIDLFVNIYIVYKTASKSITSTNALRNNLFGATKVTNASTKDPQKYNYTGWGIAFSSNTFKHPDTGGTGKNVIIFGVNKENSEKENNKKRSIMVLGYGSVKINDTDI